MKEVKKKNTKNITKVENSGKDKIKEQEKTDLVKLETKKNKIIFWIDLIVLFVLIILFIGLHFVVPIINIKGDSLVTITYGTNYSDKGATASIFTKDITKNIKVKNKVNTDKLGTYEVIYTINYSNFKLKKVRKVKVIDDKKPTITFENNSDIKVCPDAEFEKENYTAHDEYDGDITDKVKVKVDGDKVTFSVSDSSGNNYSITKKIQKIDKEKPIITLKGSSTIYLGLNETYSEPGFTVSDNCTSNLESKVKVSGEVINKQKGTYTLTYIVEDKSGNKTTVQRKIIITEKTDPNSGVRKNGTIYLTFDDGPSNVTTGEILDILKEEGVKATFFVTNNGPDYLIKRMYEEGHTVGLHTATHNYGTVYSSVDAYFRDLNSVSARVKRLTGYTSKIVRFPGGSSNTVSIRYNKGIMTRLSQELFNRGYRYYDWNVDSHDASNARTKEQVYKNVVSGLSKNRVNMVLMHDIKTATRDAIRDIIRYGKENGYTFDRIDMDTYMIRQRIMN